MAGSPLWVLPRNEVGSLPFLGIGAEEMSAADWTGDLRLTLRGVNGPGNVLVWDVGSLGELIPKMSSRDGIDARDTLSVELGSHAHYFWGFSEPGDYEVLLSASGVHAKDGAVASDPAGYRFHVVPEPATETLLLTGAALVGARRLLGCRSTRLARS